jgi:hypothetical protein
MYLSYLKKYPRRYKIKQPNNFDYNTTPEIKTKIKDWLQENFTSTDLTSLLINLEEPIIPPALNNNKLKNNILKKYKRNIIKDILQ